MNKTLLTVAILAFGANAQADTDRTHHRGHGHHGHKTHSTSNTIVPPMTGERGHATFDRKQNEQRANVHRDAFSSGGADAASSHTTDRKGNEAAGTNHMLGSCPGGCWGG